MNEVSVRLFGGPSVQRGDEVVRLTPYQRAFVTIVFERGVVSRSELARLLWNAEADSKVRSRIRQLRHQTNRRVGVEIVAARDDDLFAPDAVPADVADVQVTLTFEAGSLTLNTGASGGLTAGDIAGNGTNFVYYPATVRHWIGIEPNPYMHDELRAAGAEKGIDADFRTVTAEGVARLRDLPKLEVLELAGIRG